MDNITFTNLTTTTNELNFEYRIFMFSPEMDYTIAICGVMTTSRTCWAPTFTLIRYVSEATTTTPGDTTASLTTETESTADQMLLSTTTEAKLATESVCNPMCTKETTDAVEDQPTHTSPPVTQLPPQRIVNVISGFSSGIGILIVMNAIMLLIIGILSMKLRTLSAEKEVLQAEYDQVLVHVNEHIDTKIEGE